MQITYTASDEDFANPERGFYHQNLPDFEANETSAPLTVDELEQRRDEENVSLVNKIYVMTDFRERDLSQAFLDALEADLVTVRDAGVKLIPELVYVYNRTVNEEDASLQWTLRHIEQLKPILQEHGEVIDHTQNAFIGLWGEMHNSSNGHVTGDASLTDSGQRIIEALLDAMPENRMVNVRYPQQHERLVGEPIGAEEAYSGSDRARLGFFNDGLLYDETDFGTFYEDEDLRGEELAYWEAATVYTMVSGEPAGANEDGYVFEQDAPAYIDRLNYTSLNNSWYDAEADGVYDHWRETGEYTLISQGLGYRFEMKTAEVDTTAQAGGTLDLSFDVENVGFARAHNERPLEVVLRAGDGTVHRIETGVDARSWAEDEVTTVALALDLPDDMASGDYAVLLNLPDGSQELEDDPRYSIRLANDDVWEAATGYNALGAEVRVAADGVSAGSTKRMTYVGSDAVIANPDRGVIAFHSPEASNDDIQWQGPLSAPETQDYLNTLRDTTGATTVRVIYDIRDYRETPLSGEMLGWIGDDFATARGMGYKVAPQFTYGWVEDQQSDAAEDADADRILQHLDQLTPILEENTDVMSFMFAGFIGPWGE